MIIRGNTERYSEKEKEIVLEILMRSETTAPVEISFGYTVNNHCENGIVLKKAPGAVISMLIKKGCILTLQEDGIHVTVLNHCVGE